MSTRTPALSPAKNKLSAPSLLKYCPQIAVSRIVAFTSAQRVPNHTFSIPSIERNSSRGKYGDMSLACPVSKMITESAYAGSVLLAYLPRVFQCFSIFQVCMITTPFASSSSLIVFDKDSL